MVRSINMKQELSLTEALNIEKEIELLESKLRSEFAKEGVQARIYHELGIDRNQLSRFGRGRVPFSLRRMIDIVRVLVGK
jgi:hypothetical protein